MRRAVLAGLGIVIIGLLGIFLLAVDYDWGPISYEPSAQIGNSRVSIGILGDSNSASYPVFDEAPLRGPFQWPQILAMLRGSQIDLGVWGKRGFPWTSIYPLLDKLGARWRSPRKTDFKYNFAQWGAGCSELTTGPWRQAPKLLELIKRSPDRWREGVVVIHIGGKDLSDDALDELKLSPMPEAAAARIAACINQIGTTISMIRLNSAETKIVLVGMFDDANWSAFFERIKSPEELANITKALDRFDNGLKTLAENDPQIAFFDERVWFFSYWGGRDVNGRPDYRILDLGDGLLVRNTDCDRLDCAVLLNGHAGTVWNFLWAQAFVKLINDRWNLHIDPLSDAEVRRAIHSLKTDPG